MAIKIKNSIGAVVKVPVMKEINNRITKRLKEISDVVKAVNNILPDQYGVVTIDAGSIPYDNDKTNLKQFDILSLTSFNVQDAIDELDRLLKYNAIHTFDTTVKAAPPNLPRSYNWYIDFLGPILGTWQYSRYFYSNVSDSLLDTVGNPNIADAVAHWVIDGKHVYFEYLSGGIVQTISDLTDVNGNVLINNFRPIPIGGTWFFGESQADPFPTNDNIRSIVEINVSGLYTLLGNTFDLETTEKQIVGAINELYNRPVSIEFYEAIDEIDALNYSIANPETFVFVEAT